MFSCFILCFLASEKEGKRKRICKITKKKYYFQEVTKKISSRIKVIHIEKCRKSEKMELYTKLYTLSTKLNVEKSVDSSVKPERLFCEAFIKMICFQNRLKNLLTFES
ncbi:hypothetical protein C823_006663 [Eubacterium plexicaudatum ASF492]|nr:hypothetical protein C823_006663 [Eubacterium plexicaudatum ASF492]